MVVLDQYVGVTAFPPIVTVPWVAPKFCPVMMMGVVTIPEPGLTLEMLGGGGALLASALVPPVETAPPMGAAPPVGIAPPVAIEIAPPVGTAPPVAVEIAPPA